MRAFGYHISYACILNNYINYCTCLISGCRNNYVSRSSFAAYFGTWICIHNLFVARFSQTLRAFFRRIKKEAIEIFFLRVANTSLLTDARYMHMYIYMTNDFRKIDFSILLYLARSQIVFTIFRLFWNTINVIRFVFVQRQSKNASTRIRSLFPYTYIYLYIYIYIYIYTCIYINWLMFRYIEECVIWSSRSGLRFLQSDPTQRNCRLSASWGTNWVPAETLIGPIDHHGTLVLKGLRGSSVGLHYAERHQSLVGWNCLLTGSIPAKRSYFLCTWNVFLFFFSIFFISYFGLFQGNDMQTHPTPLLSLSKVARFSSSVPNDA